MVQESENYTADQPTHGDLQRETTTRRPVSRVPGALFSPKVPGALFNSTGCIWDVLSKVLGALQFAVFKSARRTLQKYCDTSKQNHLFKISFAIAKDVGLRHVALN